MGKIKHLTKEYKLLKKFQSHSAKNSDNKKQNWRTRRKAHEKRDEQRGDNFDSDSSDSEESQATLLDELEQVQSELLLAKNAIKLLEYPPRVDHFDVVGRLTPSMNRNQESTAPRSLVSQAGPLHWDVCSC
jgi:hypothetical protein